MGSQMLLCVRMRSCMSLTRACKASLIEGSDTTSENYEGLGLGFRV